MNSQQQGFGDLGARGDRPCRSLPQQGTNSPFTPTTVRSTIKIITTSGRGEGRTLVSSHVGPTAASDPDARRGGRFGLRQAIALIVGNIIGVGIFNLPGSLSAYGPITLLSMVLVTAGALALALLFAGLSRRLPSDGGPYAVLAGGVRQPDRVLQCVVVLDHGVGRQCRDRDRLGAVRGVPADPGRAAAAAWRRGP